MSEANDPAPVSEAKDPAATDIVVLRGNPTDEDLAALVAVLGATGTGPPPVNTGERNLWGQPIDRLRYPVFSWQRVTLLERNKLRR
ncbi:acyl-CoA carboxylase subunit epsilon [Mycobacterium sp. MYCO198283]|uniref:acyl-CoA carboxylase subunit epsilon n=1 Tax=Mycobacterium sp. MYCO198283 TaxID=2883505 RepID=UPI001E3272D5|nr:acyl-CoA carboxylase subunit epsilon [Mycobacterium sp. MYCO198283]MCG5431660.1 acyl-CoA carboxylase subunit epsilon [Mycobacterium sp. MYCO198283]